jgi:hypothetical protein
MQHSTDDNVQCEDLYELISCLLPEVTASPAQHCTYSIFGTKTSWIRSALFAFLAALLFIGGECEDRIEDNERFLTGVVVGTFWLGLI